MNDQPNTKSSPVALTRRGAIASTLAAGVVPAAVSSRAYAAGSERIKIGLIGCGGRGTGAAAHSLSTGRDAVLWAMADAFPDRLRISHSSLMRGKAGKSKIEQGSGFGNAIDVPPERQYVGLDAYRKVIDSEVDLVILTGPPGYRPLHFEAAVNAGKHVFMEKPLASDAHGVRRILASGEKARQANLKVGVGLQRHHQDTYLEAMKRIHGGEIGRIVSMRCFWNTGFPAKTAMPREDMTELQYQVRNWYFFDWLSGDHICEQHIHNLDVCNWAFGDHPVLAEGMGGRQVRTDKKYGNIFDHHAVNFEYADGTILHSYCRQIPGCSKLVAEQIIGTQGVAELSTTRCVLSSGDKTIWESPRRRGKEYQSPYQVEWNALMQAVVEDTPHHEVDYSASSTMTAILGRLATYSGKTVAWDEAMAGEKVLTTDAESWDAPAPIRPLDDGSYAIAQPGQTKVL
ncbi:Inositol 2-dehydrogenase/D-chiro-inositol 3-dehydrogenase [Stieleria maiorica]|uniref:Inositol 2-dehydrogenase/D-chiro-inositol 3-dehydrogenase n=1 Tax=Stieleria maiorica TaxID=2795974 RepID=A0A5B9MDE1_9BACT|nr:Gfo/Idh/MocA family oxidoreductase [Stieleria maiorica]QEF98256.1 Inositol 2-dehydrogenase/D-chiro-inositol 3-dehydrogenase [Stieleria maiorica]